MRIIADLHLHSKYSRSCSANLTLENIELWCGYKGINLVSTSDFTHPAWFKEIESKLIEDQKGFYKLKNSKSKVRFVIGTEISCIYTQNEKCRRVHLIVLVSSILAASKINQHLTKAGCNLKSDGRPIIGLSAKGLTKLVLSIDDKALIIPAHVWTPWYSVFGSKSGFDSLAECFEEYASNIFAIETGLSSDPAMNWQIPELINITLLSNSDAHSLNNLGREANVFEMADFNYPELYEIIKTNDRKKFLYTVEFFPEEGKYFFDGHINCQYSSSPAVSKKNNNFCPVCGKKLVLGVSHRIDDLSGKVKNESIKIKLPFKKAIPLQEIIAEVFSVGKNSKKVMAEYFRLVNLVSELEILISLPEDELKKLTDEKIATAIINVRQGKVIIQPGYDGQYGKIKILE